MPGADSDLPSQPISDVYTHHFQELLHLGKHRELLARLEDFLVLSRMRLLRERIDVALLLKCQQVTENLHRCVPLLSTPALRQCV